MSLLCSGCNDITYTEIQPDEEICKKLYCLLKKTIIGKSDFHPSKTDVELNFEQKFCPCKNLKSIQDGTYFYQLENGTLLSKSINNFENIVSEYIYEQNSLVNIINYSPNESRVEYSYNQSGNLAFIDFDGYINQEVKNLDSLQIRNTYRHGTSYMDSLIFDNEGKLIYHHNLINKGKVWDNYKKKFGYTRNGKITKIEIITSASDTSTDYSNIYTFDYNLYGLVSSRIEEKNLKEEDFYWETTFNYKFFEFCEGLIKVEVSEKSNYDNRDILHVIFLDERYNLIEKQLVINGKILNKKFRVNKYQ